VTTYELLILVGVGLILWAIGLHPTVIKPIRLRLGILMIAITLLWSGVFGLIQARTSHFYPHDFGLVSGRIVLKTILACGYLLLMFILVKAFRLTYRTPKAS
jgi:hypothetical protein